MIRVPTLMARAAAAILLASMLVLAGCHRGASKSDPAVATQGQFDYTIKAYKSGQFLVDGAVLSAADTGSHFAYLKDQGKLPKTVLVLPSDDSKIRDNHLGFMARMQLDYGFTVYYDKKGELVRLNAVEENARQLEDTPHKAALPDRMQGKEASSGAYDPQTQQ
ncbi:MULTISPECIES: hypothetical protein [unclassified Luteibacter]|uniref:hypothetical protein n=1 Tax=unclassified Luteibacter TaxID=2620188 RepID=UPI0008B83AFA|nr:MULTISPECIES: hypothetical protein [unclassified Luteibacter]MDR6936214.1 hypothetical protein [Luteibacter sp. 3190]SEO57566.1 hypothetical protein SAMN02800692_1216 [Luteibacter sp. UNC138MFCol5.1]